MHHGKISKSTPRGLEVLRERIEAATISSSKLEEALNLAPGRSYAGDHQALFQARRLTKTEFTYELSDQLPLWMQIDIDIDIDTERERLDQMLNERFVG